MRISLNSSRLRRLLVVQPLLGIVAVIAMLVGQSLAVGAIQSPSGVWIEVCGGDGTKLVQTEGGTPENNCSHCDYCAVQFMAAPLALSAPAFNSPMPVFVPVRYFSIRTNIRPGAEQYWATNRGPPLASEVNMTIYTARRATITTPVQRGASWL